MDNIPKVIWVPDRTEVLKNLNITHCAYLPWEEKRKQTINKACCIKL